ncbi:MAG: hypothetical protein J6I35_09380 [Ruminobacter sp.]|uniref:LpxL/LpxP family acyltransferase n=1 Tax=Ruminobacter sp. TaxID=2774296 RepID=UPI001B3FBE7C|nr:hypothetical protein [Ruminobacter sp.]MBP3749733.1 hypothetical protein [Ruminobacter sp.]
MVSPASWRRKNESTSAFGMNVLLFFHRLFGNGAVRIIAWCASWLVWIFNKNVRRISDEYLRNLKASASEKGIKLGRLSSRRHIYAFCRSVAGKIVSWSGQTDFGNVGEIDGGLTRSLKRTESPEPLMIIGAHIGNMEVLRAFNTSRIHKTVNVLMHMQNSTVFMDYLNKLNRDSSLNIISTADISPDISMELAERTSRGEWVSMMGDRLLDDSTRYVEVDFLGKKARFPQGPWILASILKIPVSVMLGLTDDDGVKVYYREWGHVRLDRKDREESVRGYVRQYAEELENILYAYPYEWFNFYDFWSHDR